MASQGRFKPSREAGVGTAGGNNHRAITVVSAAFLLRSIARMTQFVGGDVRKAIVFYAIWTANVKSIT
ncbi:MAG TPA: hypothetical protein VKB67_14680, partial [Rhizomicrobium sp.]|nr:hypothetical protein [Rhizomicrobium sp.]